jgi:DNA-binding transcriptional MerR regulator
MSEETVAERSVRRDGKSAAAFRTISEVASELDVPSHVLRFWETKFAQVRPLKRGGGRRYYRPEDVELLRRIRELLYRDGYTIKGVQKLLREGGLRGVGRKGASANGTGETPEPVAEAAAAPAAPPAAGLDAPMRRALGEVLAELERLRALLRSGV